MLTHLTCFTTKHCSETVLSHPHLASRRYYLLARHAVVSATDWFLFITKHFLIFFANQGTSFLCVEGDCFSPSSHFLCINLFTRFRIYVDYIKKLMQRFLVVVQLHVRITIPQCRVIATSLMPGAS
jgi:hypothetical protein